MERVTILASPMTIVDLYDLVAIKLGYNHNACTYDCRKIEVAPNFADAIEKFYEKNFSDYKFRFGMDWVCFGPKVNEDLPDDTIEVEDGFIEVTEVV